MAHALDFLAVQEIGFDIISIWSLSQVVVFVVGLVLLGLLCVVIVRSVRRRRADRS